MFRKILKTKNTEKESSASQKYFPIVLVKLKMLKSKVLNEQNSVVLLFWLLGIPGSTFGFAERANRCVSVNLLMAR